MKGYIFFMKWKGSSTTVHLAICGNWRKEDNSPLQAEGPKLSNKALTSRLEDLLQQKIETRVCRREVWTMSPVPRWGRWKVILVSVENRWFSLTTWSAVFLSEQNGRLSPGSPGSGCATCLLRAMTPFATNYRVWECVCGWWLVSTASPGRVWWLGGLLTCLTSHHKPAITTHSPGDVLHGNTEHHHHVSWTTNIYNKPAFNPTTLHPWPE